jgi:hypothetical protein
VKAVGSRLGHRIHHAAGRLPQSAL